MPPSAKRRQRVLVIAVVCLVLAGTGVGLYEWRQVQRDREAIVARDAGRAALERGEWEAALDGIGRYLQRYEKRGATAMDYVQYARARRRMELPNGKHHLDAIRKLQLALELDASCAEARKELLDLYLAVGSWTEALELIDRMLLAKPDDVELLATKCDILGSQRRIQQALDVAKQINAIAPNDIGGWFRTLWALLASEVVASDVDVWVKETIDAHPGDARFELLRAAVLIRRADKAGAAEVLTRVMKATAALDDLAFTRLLLSQLDAADRFEDSVTVLDRLAAKGDAATRRELARRLLYAGRAREIPERVAQWQGDPVQSEPEIRALVAIGEAEAGRTEKTEAVQHDLAARPDPTSRAWAALIERIGAKKGPDAAAAAALTVAVAAVPDSALLRQALGEAHAALGETDLALQDWAAAAQLATPWPRPLIAAAWALLAAPGREQLALEAARGALQRAPTDLDAVHVWVRAKALAPGEADDARAARLLELVSTMAAQSEDLLAVQVGLLARSDKGAAEARLREVLSAKSSATEATLLRLAQIADESQIPLSEQILALCESIHGVTPRLALARAIGHLRTNGNDSALRFFDSLRERAKEGTRPRDWDLVRATLLDAMGRSDAGPAWLKLADGNPDALEPQLGALASEAVWTDREAVARLIERVRKLTGDEGVTWRIERSRWLLSQPEASDVDVAEAAKLLNDVTRVAGSSTPARLLLAQALEKLGNLPGAEEQYRMAAELAPRNAWIELQIARLAQLQGKPDVARASLDRALNAGDLGPQQAEQAAYLLAVQGDIRRGADVLGPLASQLGAHGQGLLLLAQLYARLGESERAAAIYEQHLTKPTARAVELAADLKSTIGRPDEAQAVLALLDKMGLPAGDRELIRAHHAAKWGTRADALALYQRATAAAPNRPEVWTDYATFAISGGDAQTLASILEDSRAAVSEPVQYLNSVRPVVLSGIAAEPLRPLVLSMVRDKPRRGALAEAVRLGPDALADPSRRAAAARSLDAMAQADLRVLPMQLLAASVVASSGDLRRACEIAKRAMIAFPTSAAPARQAAELLAVSGRWEEALDAGLAWRDRAGRLELRPELFVANAMLRSGRALDAANGLELHTRAALADPINNEVLLLTYTTALVRSERVTRATEILNELAAKHERWRTAPLAVTAASLGSPQNVSVWLKACAANIPAGDAHARVLLAQAWAGAWNTYPSPEFLAAAKTALSGVLELPAVPPQAYMVAASVAESEGDLDAAQKHYEAALQRDSSLVVAHNNLAMILADKGRWKEAVEEAGKAAAGAPRSAEIQETVAYAWRKGGELGKARAAIEQAIALDPANPKWRISLAELSCEAGSVDEARALVVRVDEMAETGPVLPTSLRERLERVRARTQN